MNEPTPPPTDYLTKLEVVAASMSTCTHCDGKGEVVRSGARLLGLYRLAVEHHHEAWCPDDVGNQPGAGDRS